MCGRLRRANARRADLCCVVLIVAVLTVAYFPILRSLNEFPAPHTETDWWKWCAFNRSARQAIVRDRQLALRSQYLGGGYPLVAYPEDSSLSPFFVTVLLLGENAGLKVELFVKLLVGGLGMYYLLRACLGCPAGGATLGSLLFGLADWFYSKVGHGWIERLDHYLFPILLALLLDAVRGRRSIALPSAILGVALIHGKYVIPMSLLFLVIWGLPEVVRLRRPAAGRTTAIVLRFVFLQRLAMVVLVGCLLAMVKMLPMLALLGTNPRSMSYISLISMRYVGPYGSHTVFYNCQHLWDAVVMGGPPEYGGIGVGWIPLGLALLGAVLHWRETWRWVLPLTLFTWLCMGYFAPLDLWRLLWHVPVFASINKPAASANFFILMPLCVLAASVFRSVPRSKVGLSAYRLYFCVGAVAVVLLLSHAYRTNAGYFTAPLDVEETRGPFFQVQGDGGGRAYHNMVQNIGTIDWDGDILLPEYAIPVWFVGEGGPRRNEESPGEVWVVGGPRSEARFTRFTANAIDVDVRCTEPATVVINQNFHPGWHSSVGTVRSQHGLLAVADVPPGNPRLVTLRYSSRPFLVGLVVSSVSLGVLALVGLRQMRLGQKRAGGMGRDVNTQPRAREIQIAVGAWSTRKRVCALIVFGVACAALVAAAVPALRVDHALQSASVLYLQEERAGAAELCRGVLRSRPHHREARDILGKCLYSDGRFQEAAGELKTAVALGTRDVDTYLLLARSYRRLGRPRDARRVYEEALVACPGSARRVQEEYRAFRDELGQAKRLQEAERVRGSPPRVLPLLP